MTRSTLLSQDTLVFLVLMAAQLWVTGNRVPVLAPLLVTAIGCYVAADVFLSDKHAYLAKLSIVWVVIGIVAIAPTLGFIYMRHITAPYQFAHDGLIQTEEAIKFLLAGKNPYVETYFGTPMAQWNFQEPGIPVNPALDHLAYWPFLTLFSSPFYILMQNALGWFDERFIYIVMFVAVLMLLMRRASSNEKRLAMVAIAGLNPLFVSFMVEGRNDVFILFWLLLSIALLESHKRELAFVSLAFACASKPTAWFILPFFLIYCLQLEGEGLSLKKAKTLAPLGLFVAVMALTVLPFFLWNPAAFIDDVWSYTAGTSAMAYPIKSWGLGAIVLAANWVPSSAAAYPFGFWQVGLGVPALLVLCRHQLAQHPGASVWIYYGLFTLVMAFLSRVFNDNHMGYIITLFALGALTDNAIKPRVATAGNNALIGTVS